MAGSRAMEAGWRDLERWWDLERWRQDGGISSDGGRMAGHRRFEGKAEGRAHLYATSMGSGVGSPL